MRERPTAKAPRVSLVVPVYRAEAWLDRCVDSLCRQRWRDLEILLVDDGSPDRCPQLCDRWAQRDRRIRVLHKKNGGLSDARNQGTAMATGAYIGFVDADDYLAPDAVEYLWSLMEDGGADLACGGFRTVSGDGEDFRKQPPERVLRFTGPEAVRALLGNEHSLALTTAWGKLCAARLVRENPFPVGRLHEDEATAYKYCYRSRSVALGSRVIYAYRQHKGSITHTQTWKNREDTLLSWEERCDWFARQGEKELETAAADRFLNVLVDLADKGDPVCREYLREGREQPLLRRRLRAKTRARYWGYRLLGTDLNKRVHQIAGR